jgi:hypothetical protein
VTEARSTSLVRLADDRSAPLCHVERAEDLPATLDALGLRGTNACIVVAGGAARLDDRDLKRLEPIVAQALVPLVERIGAAVVDGGTDVGVMRLNGRSRASSGASFPLVGVVAAGLLEAGDDGALLGGCPLEPNHTHFVSVPGARWGDEAPWIYLLADELTPRSLTVLIDGGPLARREAEHSVRAGRPVVAVAGTGRAADRLARELDEPVDQASRDLTATGLVHAAALDDPGALADLVGRLLDREAA